MRAALAGVRAFFKGETAEGKVIPVHVRAIPLVQA